MPLKRPPNKAELRRQLQTQISHYLKHGGKVEKVAPGVSGRDDDTPLRTVLFNTPKEPRTYLDQLAAGIDRRRKPQKPEPRRKKSGPAGRYKTIYDDFGEPIRKIWVEE